MYGSFWVLKISRCTQLNLECSHEKLGENINT